MTDKKIKFKYIFSKDYNPKYVNGAYGGITPKGEIIINFYLERQGLPISQTNEIAEDDKIGKEIKSEPEDLKESIIRFVDTGIILNITSAKEIYEWLKNNIELLEKMQLDSKTNA